VRACYLTFEEDALAKRLERVRGFTSMNLVERFYIVTKDTLDLVEHKREGFQGTNRGNSVGPIVVNQWTDDDVWQLQLRSKKEVIGKAAKILVGGTAPGQEDLPNKSKDKVKTGSDVEAVFFHGLPIAVENEWHHSFNLVAMVGMAIGQGNDALTCVKRRKPYFGLTLTNMHAELVIEWLVKQTWKACMTPGSGIYEAELATLMKELTEDGKGGDGPQTDDTQQPKKKKPRKNGNGEDSKTKEKEKNNETLTKEELLAKIAALTENGDGDDGADDEGAHDSVSDKGE